MGASAVRKFGRNRGRVEGKLSEKKRRQVKIDGTCSGEREEMKTNLHSAVHKKLNMLYIKSHVSCHKTLGAVYKEIYTITATLFSNLYLFQTSFIRLAG